MASLILCRRYSIRIGVNAREPLGVHSGVNCWDTSVWMAAEAMKSVLVFTGVKNFASLKP